MAANQDPEFTTVLPSEGSPMQSSAPPHAMPPPKPSKGLSIPSTVLRILAFLLAIISFGIALRSTRMTKCIRSGPSSDTVPTDASGKATPTPLPRVGKYCDPEGSIGRDLLILLSVLMALSALWNLISIAGPLMRKPFGAAANVTFHDALFPLLLIFSVFTLLYSHWFLKTQYKNTPHHVIVPEKQWGEAVSSLGIILSFFHLALAIAAHAAFSRRKRAQDQE